MEHSSGILLYKKENGETLFFVCTPDGPYWRNRELWSFPKGHVEDGENTLKAALREFEEETSVKLSSSWHEYEYLGCVRQNFKKKVSIFAKKYNGEDMSNCHSIKSSTYYNGKIVVHNEIKKYAWMTFDELKEKGIKCYLPKYKKILKYG